MPEPPNRSAAALTRVLAFWGGSLAVLVHLGINLARWCTGESAGGGFWTLDTQALDPARAATLAPLIGALVPLVVAALLYAAWPRDRVTTPGTSGSA